MKKSICLLIVIVGMAAGQTLAQNGTVRGTLAIKKMSGNDLAGFGCSNISVSATSLNRKRPHSWQVSRKALGDIKSGNCRYVIGDVRLNSQFTVTLTADLPQACDLRIFKPERSFPMKIVSSRPFEYNASVLEIACTQVK